MTRKEFLQEQLIMSHGYALKWHASIVSGSCKQRKLQRGVIGGGYRDLTDEEKVKEAEATLGRHVDRMYELSQLLEQES